MIFSYCTVLWVMTCEIGENGENGCLLRQRHRGRTRENQRTLPVGVKPQECYIGRIESMRLGDAEQIIPACFPDVTSSPSYSPSGVCSLLVRLDCPEYCVKPCLLLLLLLLNLVNSVCVCYHPAESMPATLAAHTAPSNHSVFDRRSTITCILKAPWRSQY